MSIVESAFIEPLPFSLSSVVRYLRRSFQSQAFITCSRKGDWRQAHKADQNGLVQGHAYTITGLYRCGDSSTLSGTG